MASAFASSSRQITPPPLSEPSMESSGSQLTPDQVRRIELNRLRAKARQRQRELEASSKVSASSVTNANNKRPIGVTPATSTSPTAPAKQRALKRDDRLMGKYLDYDLSKMVNSKGGFLVEDDKEPLNDDREKQLQRERERAMQNFDPPIFLERSLNPTCEVCNTLEIDQSFRKIFRRNICNKCKNEAPEKYSLLTKTECKEDYLLTDPELRDEELLPHMLKANPHKSTFHNMMLFLRCQVEDFAWKKWGSPEALDAEYEKRVADKKKKRSKKFEEGLRELRKRTREGVWQRRKDAEHKHVFGVSEVGDDGVGKQVCHECGFTIEVEEF